MTEKDDEKIVIVGGGITGLALAYMAAKDKKKVVVIEAGKTFGGLLNTFEIGGNRLEHYYHHFFTHDMELNWLVKELNLEHLLFYQKTSMGVFNNGKIYPFNSLFDLFKFKPIKFTDKIRFILTSAYLGKLADWRNQENISCSEWFDKWAGKSTTASLWEPLLKVKFGPYSKKIPLSWMIGRLRQRMNSRTSGDEKLGYLQGSLQVLLDALIEKLKEMNVELICKQPVTEIKFNNNSVSSVSTSAATYVGDKFIFTIPGIYLSKLLVPERSDLANKLSKIKYFGAVCVILELDRPLSDIYWLNIAANNFPFGGIIEHTNFIDKKNYNDSHIVYLSRYFAMDEEIATMDNDKIQELMLGKISEINKDFSREWIKNIYLFRTNTAATVCDLNFSEKVPSCKTDIDNLYIANMSHVYPDERSTNNSIRIAAEAAQLLGIKTTLGNKTNSLSAKIGF